MAIEIGTATGFLDLMERYRDFVLNPAKAGWEAIEGGEPALDTYGMSYIASNRSGQYNCFNGRTESYVTFYDYESVWFEVPYDIEVASIKVSMPSLTGGGSILNSPAVITLYYGSDGVNWSVAGQWTGLTTWDDHENRTLTLDAPITAKWWRFRVDSSNSSNYAYVGEVQLYNSGGVRNYVNVASHDTIARVMRWAAKSPLLSGDLQVHTWNQVYMDTRTNIYTFHIGAYSKLYSTVAAGSDIPVPGGTDGVNTNCYLRDSEMDYWFYGDTHQIYGFVKVGSTIQQFGVGYILPYGTPSQYRLPMFVGAANNGLSNTYENDTDYNIRGFTNPGNGSLYVFSPQNVWEEVQNYDMASNAERLNPNDVRLWPGCEEDYNSLRNAPGTDGNNGNYVLFPLIVLKHDTSVYGELKNVYLVPSLNLASGDTITIGGDTYRVFQNQWRTSQQDYCAVKEE